MTRPRLTRALVLEERTRVPDGMGGQDVQWTPLGTLWADVAARTGRETVVAGQEAPRQRYRILVRGAPEGAPSRPRPDQRFREGARVFNILTVAEADADARHLVCDAEEGVAI